jgi:hypothetical protein
LRGERSQGTPCGGTTQVEVARDRQGNDGRSNAVASLSEISARSPSSARFSAAPSSTSAASPRTETSCAAHLWMLKAVIMTTIGPARRSGVFHTGSSGRRCRHVSQTIVSPGGDTDPGGDPRHQFVQLLRAASHPPRSVSSRYAGTMQTFEPVPETTTRKGANPTTTPTDCS